MAVPEVFGLSLTSPYFIGGVVVVVAIVGIVVFVVAVGVIWWLKKKEKI